MKAVWPLLAAGITVLLLVDLTQAQTNSTEQPGTSTPAPVKNATYWITTSSRLKPGHPHYVTVHILTGQDHVTVTVSITFQTYEMNSTARTLLTSDPVDVNPGAPQTFKIDIPTNIKVPDGEPYGRYRMRVVGEGNTVNFDQTGDLTVDERSFSIFTTTDKGVYKPGEIVHIRTLALDPASMKVLKLPMDIKIQDSKDNTIKQWQQIVGDDGQGVVQISFDLATNTPLGEWKIIATVQGQTTTKSITVDQYVIPKFQVVVNLPPIVVYGRTPLLITVKSEYTFGQPLIGASVVVRIGLNEQWRPLGYQQKAVIQRSGKLNSKGEFPFEISSKELLRIVTSEYAGATDISGWEFKVEANVTEDATKQVLSGSAVLRVYRTDLQADFLSITPQNFKPGLPFTAFLEVKKVDGTKYPIEVARKMKININVTCQIPLTKEEQQAQQRNVSGNDSSSQAKDIGDGRSGFWPYWIPTKTVNVDMDTPVQTVPETGFVSITVPSVPEEANSLTIDVKFGEPYQDSTAYFYASKAESLTNNYLQILAPAASPTVGEDFTVEVLATKPVKQLYYQVYAKGMLILNATVNSLLPEGSTTLDITFTLTREMAPTLNLIVVNAENADELVADAVVISVKGLFQETVSLTYSKDMAEPGEEIDMLINAAPNTFMFIAAREMGSELLRNDSDLTQDKVLDDIGGYDNPSGAFYPWMRYMFICGWPRSSGGVNVFSTFREISLLLLTDGPQERSHEFYPMLYGMVDDRSQPPPNGGAARDLPPAKKIRKDFREIWLWERLLVTDSNGQVTKRVKVPDGITTYNTRFFGVHPDLGLSVGSYTAKVTTFQKLFIYLDLPSFIIRNENYCFPVSLFSYFPEVINVFLIFEKSDKYKGIYVKRDGDNFTETSENKTCMDYHDDVKENEVRYSTFCFTPLVSGLVPLKVTVLTDKPDLNDAVEQAIIVKPEGVPRSNNSPFLVNLTNEVWEKRVEIGFPSGTVEDSQIVEVRITGNLLGNILDSLEHLLRQPSGCGEQNMINLAPSTYLLPFFYATNTITPELLERAKKYLYSGIQTQLTYEHGKTEGNWRKTGGFSAFGENDKTASVVLTAFVLRTLSELVRFNMKYGNVIGIDLRAVLIRSAQFIIANQNLNGSFTEHGILFHKEMVGRSTEGEAVTAFCLIALAETYETMKDDVAALNETQIKESIDLAANYLANNFENVNQTYEICLITYALTLANHPSANDCFYKMEKKAKIEGDRKFWEAEESTQNDNERYFWAPKVKALTVEITAYSLMTYARRGMQIATWLPIINWLIHNSGPNGGFTTTQDTVCGIQALTIAAAELYNPSNYSMAITIRYNDSDGRPQSHVAMIDKSNEILLQTFNIPYKNNAPKSLILTANMNTGEATTTAAIVSVNFDYNVKGETLPQYYQMSHVVNQTNGGVALTISIKWLSDNPASMTILEVQILTGYSVNEQEVAENPGVRKVDPYKDGILVVYFDSDTITNNGTNITINMYKSAGAATSTKPKSYTCSDYYEPEYSQTNTYTIVDPQICNTVDYSTC